MPIFCPEQCRDIGRCFRRGCCATEMDLVGVKLVANDQEFEVGVGLSIVILHFLIDALTNQIAHGDSFRRELQGKRMDSLARYRLIVNCEHCGHVGPLF